MRNKSLGRSILAAIALASISCATQPPESEFVVKARSASDPGVRYSEISVTVRRNPRSGESHRIVNFRPSASLMLNIDRTFHLEFGILIETIVDRVLGKRVFGGESRAIMLDSNADLNDVMTMNPFKVTHVWEIYEPEPVRAENPNPATMAGEPPPQPRVYAAPQKGPGFVCAKLKGDAKKGSVRAMEIWVAPPDSPYAAAFIKR